MRRVVARVGRPHGVAGLVTVEVRTDDPDARLAPGAVLLADPATDRAGVGRLTVSDARWHGARLLLGFAGVHDRAGAEALRGLLLEVEVDPAQRPGDPDEYYDHQLVGLVVSTVGGEPVGTVVEVVHLPAQDLLAVDTGAGTVLVPFVAPVVPEVDLPGGRLLVDPPEGLLDPA